MYNVGFIVPNLGKGGLERVVSIIANTNCFKENHKLTILTLTDSVVEYDFNHIEVIHLNKHYHKGILFKLVSFIKLYKVLKVKSFDCLFSFGEVFNPFTILAAIFTRKKIIISDRSSPILHQNFRDKFLKHFLYPFADGIIAQTELSKNILLKRKLNSNIKVIPNPLERFVNNAIYARNKTVISVGRLIPSKNQEELIEIFSSVNLKDWKLIIVGDGELRNHLQHIIDSNLLDERVKLVGKQDNIEEWLKFASIFAFTSLSEGFPNALNEAMAFPLACIAYDCPAGVNEIITQNENGIIIPFRDKDQYILKLKELMLSEELRVHLMQNAIYNRSRFDKEVIATRFINFAAEVINT